MNGLISTRSTTMSTQGKEGKDHVRARLLYTCTMVHAKGNGEPLSDKG